MDRDSINYWLKLGKYAPVDDLHLYTLSEAARFLRARGNPTGADDMQLLWDARMVAPIETEANAIFSLRSGDAA